jgi:hypothetical protein
MFSVVSAGLQSRDPIKEEPLANFRVRSNRPATERTVAATSCASSYCSRLAHRRSGRGHHCAFHSQRQFIGWSRTVVWLGVLASALVFGGAHAYQGARNMALLAVFGVLFGMLAIYRRSLRAGIFAHAWHDLIAGLALALLRSSHIF